MTLPTSGTITLLEIATEFGGSAPYSLTNYYRGGSHVPNTSTNANIPTSGLISLTNFYGASVVSSLCSGTITCGKAANGLQGYSSGAYGSISFTGSSTVNGSTIVCIRSYPGYYDLAVQLTPARNNQALFASILGKTTASASFFSSAYTIDTWGWGTGSSPVMPASGTINFAFN